MTSTRHSRSRPLMGEINIVPLVDVVLVLLIIFMVTAPLMNQGIDVALPRTETHANTPEQRTVLTITRKSAIYIDDEKRETPLDTLAQRLKTLKEKSPVAPTVYLRADHRVPHGMVVRVMDIAKRSGIDKLGIVTEPLP